MIWIYLYDKCRRLRRGVEVGICVKDVVGWFSMTSVLVVYRWEVDRRRRRGQERLPVAVQTVCSEIGMVDSNVNFRPTLNMWIGLNAGQDERYLRRETRSLHLGRPLGEELKNLLSLNLALGSALALVKIDWRGWPGSIGEVRDGKRHERWKADSF